MIVRVPSSLIGQVDEFVGRRGVEPVSGLVLFDRSDFIRESIQYYLVYKEAWFVKRYKEAELANGESSSLRVLSDDVDGLLSDLAGGEGLGRMLVKPELLIKTKDGEDVVVDDESGEGL